jgi:Methyltransferase FkbM domain
VETSLKSIMRRISFRRKFWIEQATPPAELRSLISQLHPMDNSRGLIRIGPSGDGGYLLPDDLDGVAALVSPGVSAECRFDREIAERGIDVYMADASVDGPNISHPRFHFEKKFLGHRIDDLYTTAEAFCASIPRCEGKDLIMQMDIEGAEYRIIHSMNSDLLKRFRIIVIEFHALNQLFANYSFQFLKTAFEKLLENHSVVHIHPNNCLPTVSAGGFDIPPVMEFTFYRKDRAQFSPAVGRIFPHRLDADCVVENPSTALPMCWRFRSC